MDISVRVPESGVCVHMSGEDRVWYVCDVLYAVVYVRVSCFVVHGCAVSRRHINVCNRDMFSVVNDLVLMDEGTYVVVKVMLSLMNVMSTPPALCNLSVRRVVKLCTLVVLL